MRGKWLLFGGSAILLAIAAGAWSVYRSQNQPKKNSSPPAIAAPAVFTGSEVVLNGTIRAQKVIAVAAPMDGIIDAMFAEIGQEVSQGQLLARVKSGRVDAVLEAATAEYERIQARVNNADEALVAARLESSRAQADAVRAKSDFERADKNFQRQQMLNKEGATPRLVFEKAQREYTEAKQELENKQTLFANAESQQDAIGKELDAAKRTLEEKNLLLDQAKADASAGELVSPADGVVVSRRGQAGEEVSPTVTDFFQIATELGSLEVVLEPAPPALARIKPGQQAFVHPAEFPEDVPAKVREIRGSQVIVEFESPSPAIRPGMTASVRIVLG